MEKRERGRKEKEGEKREMKRETSKTADRRPSTAVRRPPSSEKIHYLRPLPGREATLPIKNLV